jgi:hypothetical protein
MALPRLVGLPIASFGSMIVETIAENRATVQVQVKLEDNRNYVYHFEDKVYVAQAVVKQFLASVEYIKKNGVKAPVVPTLPSPRLEEQQPSQTTASPSAFSSVTASSENTNHTEGDNGRVPVALAPSPPPLAEPLPLLPAESGGGQPSPPSVVVAPVGTGSSPRSSSPILQLPLAITVTASPRPSGVPNTSRKHRTDKKKRQKSKSNVFGIPLETLVANENEDAAVPDCLPGIVRASIQYLARFGWLSFSSLLPFPLPPFLLPFFSLIAFVSFSLQLLRFLVSLPSLKTYLFHQTSRRIALTS